MNCPSRTDEIPNNPGWNQSPPLLPGDLTTRHDFNGRINARTLRGESGLSEICFSDGSKDVEGYLSRPPGTETTREHVAEHLQFYNKESASSATNAGLLICPQGPQGPRANGICQQSRQYWKRILWSLLLILFLFGTYRFRNLISFAGIGTVTPSKSSLRRLTRRGSTCGNSQGGPQDYNTPLHVGALLIILFVSTSTCAFPMFVIKFPCLRIPAGFLFVVRHFGTGVLIATAFCHLLPTAFISLGDPCLSKFWTKDYPAIPGAIALAAVFMVALVEMILSPAQHMCSSASLERMTTSPPRTSPDPTPVASTEEPIQEHRQTRPRGNSTKDNNHMRRDRPLIGRSSSIGRGLAHMNAELGMLDQIEPRPRQPDQELRDLKHSAEEHAIESSSAAFLTPEQKHKKALMQCMLLEMGILFHSVFIGMALSVSVGNDFVILLIAITFHQTFEGLALGARIAALEWDKKALQPWLMALAYGLTTPLGQAIGIGTHTLYDPASEVGLIMVGTMNAISSGLLVYASLVELLSEDFLSDESWRLLRGRRRVFACILVFAGAFGMSLIGAWA
ncbi:hypothetical protein AJ80_07995 [Polytolypa hystricis UAMH7299]|uniref:Uncharacterized protein n=1 Tax=Polytolypa hystricis (strain UAMH7299) TaxID=1447883 RepID=A0A2B7XET5_POLH7|nr:hypothetical protein AJ80_07995 [Polytolypa hystricis UAMH7299]